MVEWRVAAPGVAWLVRRRCTPSENLSSPGLDPSSSTEGQLHRAPSGVECVGTHASRQRFSKCPSGISSASHLDCAKSLLHLPVPFRGLVNYYFSCVVSFVLVACPTASCFVTRKRSDRPFLRALIGTLTSWEFVECVVERGTIFFFALLMLA